MEHVLTVPVSTAPAYKPCFDLRYFHGTINASMNEAFVKLLLTALNRLGARKPLEEDLSELVVAAQTALTEKNKHAKSKGGHFAIEGLCGNYYLITSKEFGIKLLDAVDRSAGRDGLEPPLYALSEKLEERLYPKKDNEN